MRSQERIIADLIADLPPMSEEQEAVENLRLEVSQLEGLLDNYRGDCHNCGRINVLLEPNPGEYDSPTCLLDTDECERLHKERLEAEGRAARLERAARQQRLADGTATRDDHWKENLDTVIRSTLEMQHREFTRLAVFKDLIVNSTPIYWSRFDSELEKE